MFLIMFSSIFSMDLGPFGCFMPIITCRLVVCEVLAYHLLVSSRRMVMTISLESVCASE
jgi:hypothetical protein